MTDQPDDQVRPEGNRCEVHNIAVGPNGCVLCRRQSLSAEKAYASGSPALTNWLIMVGLVAAISGSVYLYTSNKDEQHCR